MSDARNELLERWLETVGLREDSTERPKATGNTLGEAFMAELCRSWETHGQSALATVADKKPESYLKLVASFAAKNAELTSDDLEDLKDGELSALIRAARAALKAHDQAGAPGDEES
jgi:hypothetical protein